MMQVQSRACCTNPPVVLAGGYDYELRGKYVEYNGLKTCKTTRIYRPLPVSVPQHLNGSLASSISLATMTCGLTYMQYR